MPHGELPDPGSPDQGASTNIETDEDLQEGSEQEGHPEVERTSQTIIEAVGHLKEVLGAPDFLQPIKEHLVATLQDMGFDAEISDSGRTEGEITIPWKYEDIDKAVAAMNQELVRLGIGNFVYAQRSHMSSKQSYFVAFHAINPRN